MNIKIEKLNNRIVKIEARRAKALRDLNKELAKEDWDGRRHDFARRMYDIDIRHVEEDLAKAHAEIAKEEARENAYANLPEVLHQYRAELLEALNTRAIEVITLLNDARKNDPEAYDELLEDESIRSYNWVEIDEALAQNETYTRKLIEDIAKRATAKIGTITDAKGLHLKGGILNGHLVGERGMVEVRMIQAGGYNIQRLHDRVLVL